MAASARRIALQMLAERGRGAVLVGMARVDAAPGVLRGTHHPGQPVGLITPEVGQEAVLSQAAAQQLRPIAPAVVMGFGGIGRVAGGSAPLPQT